MNTQKKYDVIVVGGGHAGIEAAYASARMGSSTLVITLNLEKIGFMPCNPAIGGIGKGHIVYEVSALGGLMPQLCTDTYLQARMLNTRKGPAVQGLRLQIDKVEYNQYAGKRLAETPGVDLLQDCVDDVITNESGAVTGVKVQSGKEIHAPTVIITTGTFLNGLTHVGQKNESAGRQGERAVTTLSQFLIRQGFKMGRLKTGTPARLKASSLDFSVMDTQESDDLHYLFELKEHTVRQRQACHITRTTEKTHDIIRRNFDLSPIFTGHVKGTPPRYCPSIEDKISRFPHKTSHQVFVEPESIHSDEIYPNGISTALPAHIQEEYIHSIPGFEKAEFARYGYAIEYDYVAPNQLTHTLETKYVKGLFLAGQINGTTGYEEAAGQGIVAGINAHLKAHNQDPFILNRTESYIGIMIDDLISMGVDEPYRMFTSRAERRLLLRQDNVFNRLSHKAYNLGLISLSMYEDVLKRQEVIRQTYETLLKKTSQSTLSHMISSGNVESVYQEIIDASSGQIHKASRELQTVYADVLYGPYLKREEKEVEKAHYYQSLEIPHHMDFKDIPGLSVELQQKLKTFKPATIGQASLIPAMTPAAISLLIFKIREYKQKVT
jgi:tRNA uridine 5-carboxymethylaminomethyl modification enzyme